MESKCWEYILFFWQGDYCLFILDLMKESGRRADRPEIVIFERDERTRRIIRESVQAAGLESIRFIDDLNKGGETNEILLYLCVPGTPLPDHPALSERNIFVKPLRLGRLLDRLHSLQKNQETEDRGNFIKIGPYNLDITNNILGTIPLTEKETAILRYLQAQKGRNVSRNDLLDNVWGYAQGVETHTLETHIYRLRQKIEKDATAPEIVLTEENGYRLGQ